MIIFDCLQTLINKYTAHVMEQICNPGAFHHITALLEIAADALSA